MRATPQIDQHCAQRFGLSGSEVLLARRLLSRMGGSTLTALAREALEGPENIAQAALWSALRAPQPWPWMGAEFEHEMIRQGPLNDEHVLHCALLALPFNDPLAPLALIDASAALGGSCEQLGRSASQIKKLSGHGIRNVLHSLALGGTPVALTPEILTPGLRAWFFLVRLPLNAPLETFEQMLAEAAQLNTLGSAPPWALLGSGSLSSTLAHAGALCAPLELRAQLESLSRSVMLNACDLACSVSAHADGTRTWLRVALRSPEGMLLAGLEWPAEHHEKAFSTLLFELTQAGASPPEIVEGCFDSKLCKGCSEPIYPMPERPDWRLACRDYGLPEDGSHPGCL